MIIMKDDDFYNMLKEIARVQPEAIRLDISKSIIHTQYTGDLNWLQKLVLGKPL